MNTDDPKFTAHALGDIDDLTPAERAEIEALLATDADAAAEAAETRALAARLRAELQSEQSAPLTAGQRAAVLAANVVPVSLGGAGEVESADARPRRPARWLTPLALAASVALCASLAWKAAFPPPVLIGHDAAFAPQDAPSAPVAPDDPAAPHPEPEGLAMKSEPRPLAPAPTGAKPVAQEVRMARPVESLVQTEAVAAAPAPDMPLPAPKTVSASDLLGEMDALRAKSAATAAPEPHRLATPTLTTISPAAPPPQESFGRRGGSAKALAAAKVPAKPGALAGRAMLPARDRYAYAEGETEAVRLQRGDVSNLGMANLAKEVQDRTRGFGLALVDDSDSAESYDFIPDNAFLPVAQAPLSTFSIDVDTASYAIVRRFLNEQHLPPKGAVRIEELINYFTYDYPQPQGDAPFSATMEVAACPWTPAHRLVRIGLKGREIANDQRPASNLVFLIDVSGSMQPANKLPLLKQSLGLLIDKLGEIGRAHV